MIKDEIIKYITEKYAPEAIITYGSFADGSNNEHSDFDALVIAGSEKTHDASVVCGTVLDVFVYPPETFDAPYDPEDFVQIYDGSIVLDKSGTAEMLKSSVAEYFDSVPEKSDGEIRQEIEWCGKMLSRTERGDAEGYFRWHWLLFDSLEIYFDAKRLRYRGPKKSLRLMASRDPEAFEIYSSALRDFSCETLTRWVRYIEKLI